MSPGDEASDKISQATVEVIADRTRVAEARQQSADYRKQELARLLANPQEIHSYDREARDLLEASRDFSVQSLMRLRDNIAEGGSVRLAAMLALKVMGIHPDMAAIAKLVSSDHNARKRLLLSWRDLFAKGHVVSQSMSDLIMVSIESEDSHMQSLAASNASWSRIKAATPSLLRQIRSLPDPDRALLQAVAELQQTDEILDALEERLPSNIHESSGCLEPVATLGLNTQDPELQKRAARICFDHLKGQEDSSSIGGDVSDALKLIANAYEKSKAKEMLSSLAMGSTWTLLRRYALEEVRKLDGMLASDIAWAAELHPEPQTRSVAFTNDALTPQQVSEICVRHGVLERDEAQKAADQECRVQGEHGGDSVIGLFLALGRMEVVVMDTGCVPVRHDLLLTKLAKGSAGRFQPEAALERYRDNLPDPTPQERSSDMPGRWVPVGTGTYEAQFVHADRLYRFSPRDFGDWYDLDSVLTAANRALGDAGVPDRFMALDDTGDCAVVIFAKAEALHAAAGELGLRLRPAL